MWRKIKLLLGVYNLRDACAERVEKEYGKDAVENFLGLYDKINSGASVHMLAAVAVIEVVEKTKKELKQQTLLARVISWLGNKKENNK